MPAPYCTVYSGCWERYGNGWNSSPLSGQGARGAVVFLPVLGVMLKRKKWCEPMLMEPTIFTRSTSLPNGLPNCWHM